MKKMLLASSLVLAGLNAQANPVYKEMHEFFSSASALNEATSTKVEGSDPALDEKTRKVFDLLQTCEVKTSETEPSGDKAPASSRYSAELVGGTCPLTHKEVNTYESVRNRDLRSKQALNTVVLSHEIKKITGLRAYSQRVNAYIRDAFDEEENSTANFSMSMKFTPTTGAALKISILGKMATLNGAESSELKAKFRYKGAPWAFYFLENADGSRLCKINNVATDCGVLDYIMGESDNLPGEEASAQGGEAAKPGLRSSALRMMRNN
jgi:hypothetical protein